MHDWYPHYYYQKILLALLRFAEDETEADDIKRRWGEALGEFEVISDTENNNKSK